MLQLTSKMSIGIQSPLRHSIVASIGGITSVRGVHDIMISRTGKPIIRKGPGGRSSDSGHIVTVFGCTGFLGGYVVSKLGKQGSQIVLPYRDITYALPLKVSADLGMTYLQEYDPRDMDAIERAVKHSDTVYNLIGTNYETRNYKFDDVHVTLAQRIAEAVAKYNVSRFIHVSSYNADPSSESRFYASKGRGEIAVREIFPEATIVRPPPMFGTEDRLLNPLAAPRFYFPSTTLDSPRVYPAYVNDVALALEIMMHEPSTTGQTYDLAGPESFTREDLLSLVHKYSQQKPRVIHIPRVLKTFIAEVHRRTLYWNKPGWSPDEIVREHIDHVPSTEGPNGEKVLGWKDLPGMTALEPVDGLMVKTQMRNFQREAEATRLPKRKSEAEKARDAEMNRIL